MDVRQELDALAGKLYDLTKRVGEIRDRIEQEDGAEVTFQIWVSLDELVDLTRNEFEDHVLETTNPNLKDWKWRLIDHDYDEKLMMLEIKGMLAVDEEGEISE